MTILAPTSTAEVVEIITSARADGDRLWFSGSGTTAIPSGSTGVTTAGLSGVVDYKPDDLTVVVRSGTRLEELASVLAEHGHTAVLPEVALGRTVGGVVASGDSGYRRLRYGPTRDRVIGLTIVTGYGEIVHAGGQLVKNVTGYDLPRLVTGSHGALGLIIDVSFKLWPIPKGPTTVEAENVADRRMAHYQPIAALSTEKGGYLYTADPDRPDGDFTWPAALTESIVLTMNVPARCVPEAIVRIEAAGAERFVAQHGVGVVEAGWNSLEDESAIELRRWAESVGGSMVIARRGVLGASISRWGSDPDSIGIQRELKRLFDPHGVCNPGVLPGGV